MDDDDDVDDIKDDDVDISGTPDIVLRDSTFLGRLLLLLLVFL